MIEDQRLEQIELVKSQYETKKKENKLLKDFGYVVSDTLYEKDNECKLIFTAFPALSNKNIMSKEDLRDVLIEYFEELIANKKNPMWNSIAGVLICEELQKEANKKELEKQ